MCHWDNGLFCTLLVFTLSSDYPHSDGRISSVGSNERGVGVRRGGEVL